MLDNFDGKNVKEKVAVNEVNAEKRLFNKHFSVTLFLIALNLLLLILNNRILPNIRNSNEIYYDFFLRESNIFLCINLICLIVNVFLKVQMRKNNDNNYLDAIKQIKLHNRIVIIFTLVFILLASYEHGYLGLININHRINIFYPIF